MVLMSVLKSTIEWKREMALAQLSNPCTKMRDVRAVSALCVDFAVQITFTPQHPCPFDYSTISHGKPFNCFFFLSLGIVSGSGILAPKLVYTYNLQQNQKFALNNHFPTARMQSGNHHLLDYAKPSNSTPSPTLSPGRSQARAGDFPSVRETSGMASMERPATSPRRSHDESLRGIPAPITSESADIGIGSGVEEYTEVLPPKSYHHKYRPWRSS
ncbi:hypothetical protein EDD15DRAFT_753991 [Pisolithus albus]|nr:hypothetical protein EDD15DRAFT_753991 [Pisolithus albus]